MNAYTNLWSTLNALGTPEEGLSEFDNHILFLKQKSNYENVIDALLIQSKHCRSLGYYQEAIEKLNAIANNAIVPLSDETSIRAEHEIGICYFLQGNYQKALKTFVSVDSTLTQISGLNDLKLQVKNNIAGIYMTNEDYANALKMLKQVNMLSEKIGYAEGLGPSYTNTGIAFKFLGEYDSALFYYHKALNISDDGKYYYYKTAIHSNIGEIHEMNGNIELALTHFRKSIEFAMIEPQYRANALISMARINLKLENFAKSDSLLNESFEILQNHNIPERLKEAYHVKYLYDSASANYYEALKSYIHYTHLKDSLLSEEKQKDINRLQAKYELREKEQQIKIQHNEIANKNSTIRLYLFAIIASILVLIFVIVYLNISKKKQLIRKEFEIQKNKLSILSGQINEHFVSNSIARVYSLMEMNRIDQAKKYANAFVSFLRQHIGKLDQELNSLHNELIMVKSYVEMQNLRDKNIHLNLPANESIDTHKLMMPHFLLQPIVENAIIHGFSNLDDRTGEITIVVEKAANYFQIIIKDNGCGISQKQNAKNKRQSIGLANIDKRLKLMNRKNKIEVQSGKNGTRVIISIYQKNHLS